MSVQTDLSILCCVESCTFGSDALGIAAYIVRHPQNLLVSFMWLHNAWFAHLAFLGFNLIVTA
jgi:hypothetical protein